MITGVWKTSSYSQPLGENCVEVAIGNDYSRMRDSQYPSLGHLGFPTSEWRAFLSGLKSERRPEQG
ncbi:DUF397 domain-containing protein [Nocardiopsis potens]|uniref:DUF397 domain-containing protein n=1 Tax=Nocardiopsis potens TaxID=1246458 RepID=UPI000365F424|nr:DUF397 domain-containing protein [Nocardiopsis potens]